jgi:hypothetical protein
MTQFFLQQVEVKEQTPRIERGFCCFNATEPKEVALFYSILLFIAQKKCWVNCKEVQYIAPLFSLVKFLAFKLNNILSCLERIFLKILKLIRNKPRLFLTTLLLKRCNILRLFSIAKVCYVYSLKFKLRSK